MTLDETRSVARSKPRFPMLSFVDWHLLLVLVDILTAVISVFLVVMSGRVFSSIAGETIVSFPWAIGLLVSVFWPVILRMIVGPSVARRGVVRTGLLIGVSAVVCGGLVAALFGLGESPIIQRSVFFSFVCWMKRSCSGYTAGACCGLLK